MRDEEQRIEALAAALYLADAEGFARVRPWGEITTEGRGYYRRLARAALEHLALEAVTAQWEALPG